MEKINMDIILITFIAIFAIIAFLGGVSFGIAIARKRSSEIIETYREIIQSEVEVNRPHDIT